MDTRPVLVFGGSSTLVFRGADTIHAAPFKYPGIDILHCAESTAWGLGRLESRFTWLLEKAFLKRRHSAIVIALGNLDCRKYIVGKADEHGHTIEEEAASVAERLFNAVKAASAYGDAPFAFVAPIASAAVIKYAHWGVSGSLQERNRATMAFRDALAMKARVIDTLDITMNSDFTTQTEALFDPIHLSAKHLPAILDRLRDTLHGLGVEWAETGGGDFKLAHRGDRPGVTAHGSPAQTSPLP